MNQNSGDLAVLNRDDPIVMKLGERCKSEKSFFQLEREAGRGRFLRRPNDLPQAWEEREKKYSLAKAPLKGIHNVENMMAALDCGQALRLLEEGGPDGAQPV